MSMKLAGRVWTEYRISPRAAFILMALCDSANDDGANCFASEEYLIWKTGVGRATLYRHLADLEHWGVLTSRRLADGRTERTINLEALPAKAGFQRSKRGGTRKPKESRPAREKKQQPAANDPNPEHLGGKRGRQRPTPTLPATPAEPTEPTEPTTPPDVTDCPAGSDVASSPAPAGDMGGRGDRRHAEAAANAESLRWSERTRLRFPTPAERRHAYALAQGFTDWPALVANRAERFARLEAHA